MDTTVLMPVQGKSKFKFSGLSAPQLKVLNENRNNIFKALATFGGAYLAYETYQQVIDITKEEWMELLPDELEKLLAPFLQDNIDVDECITAPEIPVNETTEPEIIPDESIAPAEKEEPVEEKEIIDHSGKAEEIMEEQGIDEDLIEKITENEEHTVIDEEMQEYINSDEFLEDLNDDSAVEVIINDEFIEDSDNLIFEEEESGESFTILDEKGIDEDLIKTVTDEESLEIDDEMMAYINSGDILIDLNEDSADEIIINNEYIDSDEEIFIDDSSEFEGFEEEVDLYESENDWESWEDEEDMDIDLNDIPDNI